MNIGRMKTLRFSIILVFCLLLSSCKEKNSALTWSVDELSIIDASSPLMRVLTIDNQEDSLFLRQQSCNLSGEDIMSETYSKLAEGMLATVTSPEQEGVGIAGPQVGISRRVVAVQRFDKEGEPFEVYPNIEIVAARGEKECGGEGCLSVPDRYGNVNRFLDIDIRYTSPKTLNDTMENVQGFTAVIFQHECDHLQGILYIDYLEDDSI